MSIDQSADGSHVCNLHLDVAFRILRFDRAELNAMSDAGGGFAAVFTVDGG